MTVFLGEKSIFWECFFKNFLFFLIFPTLTDLFDNSFLIKLSEVFFLNILFSDISLSILKFGSSSSFIISGIELITFLFSTSEKQKGLIDKITSLLIGLWVLVIILDSIISIGTSIFGKLNKYLICLVRL